MKMPCPNCGTPHEAGEYTRRPDLQEPGGGVPHCPPDVKCECGVTLRHTVPIFKIGDGWVWRIVET